MVTISGLTIRHGNGSFSGNPAGGIYNAGTLTLDRVVLRANYAGQGGGAISNSQVGTLTVANSLIADNRAGSFGGGMVNGGMMTVENTTLSGNRAGFTGGAGSNGGAIQNAGRVATLAMTNCTIANNSANGTGGGIANAGGTATLTNTIVAGNATGGDTGGTGITSDHSLIGGDPLLAPLADNGGPTQTMLPLPGSPAIDAGAANGCPATDQRGIARLQGPGCDIGAFEANAPAPTITSIAVRPTNPSIAVGATQQFAATGVFSDGHTADLTASVTWSSTDVGVATITTGGLATGVAGEPPSRPPRAQRVARRP